MTLWLLTHLHTVFLLIYHICSHIVWHIPIPLQLILSNSALQGLLTKCLQPCPVVGALHSNYVCKQQGMCDPRVCCFSALLQVSHTQYVFCSVCQPFKWTLSLLKSDCEICVTLPQATALAQNNEPGCPGNWDNLFFPTGKRNTVYI